jgi:3-hydroxyisobutyrate dehydrogenase-like beta-hydroxyacid dehydrogenase
VSIRVGLLFPGSMGAPVGGAARAEVVWASEGRSEATARRAAEAGLVDVGSLEELVRSSEIVLSICPPAIAEEVAGRVAELGFEGLYVDANAISPERMRRIARLLPNVVDGSVLGGEGNFYLSGEPDAVERVATLFADSDVRAVPLEAELGAASALKMAYGGWNKIGVALAAQAHAIARAYGVADALESEGLAGARIEQLAPRAWRWGPEMEEVADTCAALGLPDGMGRGAAELYGRWSGHRDTEVPLERLLDELGSS